uniref:Uncharacterized protein n=1 Tax=Oncorhynchus tshawytscha TaxID=74940 RepID=A0AAZ3R2M0_ONCTS
MHMCLHFFDKSAEPVRVLVTGDVFGKDQVEEGRSTSSISISIVTGIFCCQWWCPCFVLTSAVRPQY